MAMTKCVSKTPLGIQTLLPPWLTFFFPPTRTWRKKSSSCQIEWHLAPTLSDGVCVFTGEGPVSRSSCETSNVSSVEPSNHPDITRWKLIFKWDWRCLLNRPLTKIYSWWPCWKTVPNLGRIYKNEIAHLGIAGLSSSSQCPNIWT